MLLNLTNNLIISLHLIRNIQHQSILRRVSHAVFVLAARPPLLATVRLLHVKRQQVMIRRLLLETIESVLKCTYPGHVFKECCSVTEIIHICLRQTYL